jgi:hypothetical protein
MNIKIKVIFFILSIFQISPWMTYSSNLNQKKNEYESIKRIIIQDDLRRGFKPTKIFEPFISSNYALITILHGEMGGQAILKKNKNTWKIIMQGGGSFGKQGLIEYGVPPKDADNIMRQQEKAFKKK